ncbi:MAG: Gfo/Idh/MocA family oxidoreductase, partial [Lentisphaerae bacterium]|nr:Gfo/Idh/MocA family oxidoreductase [Lentisphaerota bacterium]
DRARLPNHVAQVRRVREHPDMGRVEDFRDFEDVLRRDDIEAVFLYVPDALHEDFARRALEAGKYVLCTKPMAHSLASARRMAEAAQAHPGHFMLGFQFCYSAFIRAALDIIARGRIGTVRQLYFEHHRKPFRPPHRRKYAAVDGSVTKEGCHWLDLFYRLGGQSPFQRVCAFGGLDVLADIQDVDDNGVIILQYRNGLKAFYGYSYFRSRRPGWGLTVVGDRGSMQGDFTTLYVENEDGEETIEVYREASPPYRSGHHGYYEMHDAFAAMILEGQEPYSNWRTGLENELTAYAAQRAVMENRTVTREEAEQAAQREEPAEKGGCG